MMEWIQADEPVEEWIIKSWIVTEMYSIPTLLTQDATSLMYHVISGAVVAL